MDVEKCVRCGFCWMYCPERAVRKTGDGGYEIDYSYCKGCGICAEECPREAIRMVEEE
jgi:pyruvate ferredoxin oxidoreductase delta subunit